MSSPCFCGHDCSRCLILVAERTRSPELRAKAREFYRTRFGLDIPDDRLHCEGGRSDNPFFLCKECPFSGCCREKGLDSCDSCQDKCDTFLDYRARFVNKCGQIDQ